MPRHARRRLDLPGPAVIQMVGTAAPRGPVDNASSTETLDATWDHEPEEWNELDDAYLIIFGEHPDLTNDESEPAVQPRRRDSVRRGPHRGA